MLFFFLESACFLFSELEVCTWKRVKRQKKQRSVLPVNHDALLILVVLSNARNRARGSIVEASAACVLFNATARVLHH